MIKMIRSLLSSDYHVVTDQYPIKKIDGIPIELNPLQSAFYDMYSLKRHYIVSAPTNTGKTALVMFLAMKKVLSSGQRVVMTAPTRALVRQIYLDTRQIFGGRLVGIYTGETKDVDEKYIVVATPEGLLSAIRKEEEWALTPTLVVMDEVHYLWDKQRGPALDFLLYYYKDKSSLLLLSATMPEVKKLQKYLNAVVLEYKPEKTQNEVIKITIPDELDLRIKKIESILSENQSGSVIIFVPTKEIGSIISRHFNIPFHSADSSEEERKQIEEDFISQKIKTIVSTSTLAVGVNTPADVVIVAGLRAGYYYLDSSMVRQMVGRAGRGQKTGKCYILGDEIELSNLQLKFDSFITPPLEQYLLTIALKPVSITDIYRALQKSFWGSTVSKNTIFKKTQRFLQFKDIITFNNNTVSLTPMGILLSRYCIPLEKFFQYIQFLNLSESPERKFVLAATILDFKDVEPPKKVIRQFASIVQDIRLCKIASWLFLYYTGRRKPSAYFSLKDLQRWLACLKEIESTLKVSLKTEELAEVYSAIDTILRRRNAA
jgi:superfamily II DNA/RNA helicase